MYIHAKQLTIIFVLIFFNQTLRAQTITGLVTDSETGKALPFASIYIKGTTKGTTTNDEGKYTIETSLDNNTLVCKYVGYQKEEKQIGNERKINFQLNRKHTQTKAVIISDTGEDPAYKIIRQAIKKRPYYNKAITEFEANCYIKGKIKLDETPEGKGVFNLLALGNQEESADELKKEMEDQKGIIFLSESYSKIGYRQKPEEFKIKVLSSKVSGSQDAYGFSTPLFINFYNNNISFGNQLSPRGFVSPIASGALHYYKYKLLETYFEDGQWVNKIQVIPKRKLEPLLTGEIHIIDNSWRIHSLDVVATKDFELSVLDSVRIKQIHVPSSNGYVVKDQTFGIVFRLFGFGVRGQFVNVFTNYKDQVSTNFFDRYVIEYDSLALKQNDVHWDSIRVIPLEKEEVNDYVKKDSISKKEQLKADSIRAIPYSYKPWHILRRGLGIKFTMGSIKTDALIGLNRLKYNTVEGLAYELPVRYKLTIDKDKSIYVSAWGRYGFSNKLLSSKVHGRYNWGKSNRKKLSIGAGQYVFQYNNNEPVNEFLNSLYTLFYGQNFLKLYRAKYAKVNFGNQLFNGFSYQLGVDYQDRNALNNSTNYMLKWIKKEENFTANYPTEILQETMRNNKRLALKLSANYQPGRRLIKYPDRIVSTSSRYPELYASIEMSRPILNTHASYLRWASGLSGDFDFNLLGHFKYNWQVGGFIDKEQVFVPDFKHFNGNQLILASPYLSSFQLAPYYANSNTESFYTSFHIEHHFNGLGTNKIPLFRKMKYYLVGASNGYYVNQDNNYMELSAGLENVGFGLFRFFRVDAVFAYQNFSQPKFGIRLGISGGMISLGSRKDTDE